MKTLFKIFVILFFSFSLSFAEIEKFAYSCGNKICFNAWPKLPDINNWKHDRKVSLHYSMNVIIPQGYNFSNAKSIIYARAILKEKVSFKTLDEFIQNDINSFKINKPEVKIFDVAMKNKFDKKYYKSLKFFANKSYEQLYYTEEKDQNVNEYYVLFTLSAFSENDYNKSLPVFEELLFLYNK